MSTVKAAQEPMYLSGVEENPKPSIYRDLIENAKSSGGDYWQIWHLLAFDPEAGHHLASLSHTLMHKPGPLSAGLRELIAAYTSSLNNCEFCMKAHAAVASKLLGDESLVWSVIDNFETSPLAEKEKALLRFVRKITLAPASIAAVDTLHLNPQAGTMRPSSTRSPPAPFSTSTTAGSRPVVSILSATKPLNIGFPDGCCGLRQVML